MPTAQKNKALLWKAGGPVTKRGAGTKSKTGPKASRAKPADRIAELEKAMRQMKLHLAKRNETIERMDARIARSLIREVEFEKKLDDMKAYFEEAHYKIKIRIDRAYYEIIKHSKLLGVYQDNSWSTPGKPDDHHSGALTTTIGGFAKTGVHGPRLPGSYGSNTK